MQQFTTETRNTRAARKGGLVRLYLYWSGKNRGGKTKYARSVDELQRCRPYLTASGESYADLALRAASVSSVFPW
jgi:hypothetical protein